MQMLVVAALVFAIACCPLSSADSVFWKFSSSGCSGPLIDWHTVSCWSKLPAVNDDVTITPPINIPSFSVVISSVVEIRSLMIDRYTSIVLNQVLNVSESCQLCGTLNSTRGGGSFSCKSLKSCASFGASLFSGFANSSLTIIIANIQNVSFVAEAFGKLFFRSTAECSRCSVFIQRGGEFQAFGNISSSSADDCDIINFGRLVLGQEALAVHSHEARFFDCSVSSSSEVIVESMVLITRPVNISQLIKLHPSATLSLAHTVVMQSLKICQTHAGQPATILLRPLPQVSISIDATIASGVLASFDSCPDTTMFLNISSSADIQWNCASSFFSAAKPSTLVFFGQAQIRFGSTRSVQINAAISAEVSSSFVSTEEFNDDPELKARWSILFNMQNPADALIASNILLDFTSPSCYKPPSISISLFESSSIVFQGSHVLLFGVSLWIYDTSDMNVTSQTTYLQSLYVRSSMTVHAGNLYVSFAIVSDDDNYDDDNEDADDDDNHAAAVVAADIFIATEKRQVSQYIDVGDSCSLRVNTNASLYAMDFTMKSSFLVIDGIFKIVYYMFTLSSFHAKKISLFSKISCPNNKPALFVSGSIRGTGYIALMTKYIRFAPSSSSDLSWSGPTLLLKLSSVFETSTFAAIDADIIFENAKLSSCGSSAVTISTNRGIFVKRVVLSAHEFLYDVGVYYSYKSVNFFYQPSALLTRITDVMCTASLILESK